MTKVECESLFIDRSSHIGSSRTSNGFDLNYPGGALYIYILYIYYIKKMDNPFLDSIEAQRGE